MLLNKLSNNRLDNFLLSKQTLGNFYLNGSVYGGTIIDHSVPVRVVNAAYDTSGNGGRKLVRLNSGRLVACMLDMSASYRAIRLFKSDDNGGTWSQLCYVGTTNYISNDQGFAISTDGVNIGLVFFMSGHRFIKINGDTQANTNVYTSNVLITNTSSTTGAGVSLVYQDSNKWHIAWSDKVTAYPDSFNIRYSKSTDGGATWATPTQVTMMNNTGGNVGSPSIIIVNDVPMVFAVWFFGGSNTHFLYAFSPSGLPTLPDSSIAWYRSTVFSSSSNSYIQTNPCAVVDGNGVIHVVWHGTDSTDSDYYNIRYSKSTDNGATWSTAIKLTSGNANHQLNASITANKDNEIFVLWHGFDPTIRQIKRIAFKDNVWGNIETLTNNTTASASEVSTCANYTDFTDPLCIYRDEQAGDIKFRGVFTV